MYKAACFFQVFVKKNEPRRVKENDLSFLFDETEVQDSLDSFHAL